MNKSFRALASRIGVFELALIAILSVGIFIIAIILFRTTKSFTVTIIQENPPYWYAYSLHPGDAETDTFGKKQAELLHLRYYPSGSTDKIVFIKLKLQGVYSRSKRQFSYKGKPLIVGSAIRVELQNQLIQGVIQEIENVPSPYQEKDFIVKAKVQDFNPVYPETEGSPQYIADAIKIGDTMRDSNKNIILTVMDKTVVPANRYITGNGKLSLARDPLKKDIYLTLKISVQIIQEEMLFLQTFRVKVGDHIPLDLPTISTWPVITEVLSE